jgi:large subunit ribosomal protein L15e
MGKSFYSHIKQAWKTPKEGKVAELQWQRKQQWRQEGAFVKVERPTRLDRARALGYKAKQGIVIVRSSVRKGGSRKSRHKAGRRSKRQGVNRLSRRKSIQRIAEERVSRILVDPEHPAIQADDDLNWICADKHRGRAFRGLTNAGKKGRGMQRRGKGTEHTRPSITGDRRRGK